MTDDLRDQLATLRARQQDVTDPGRQVPPTAAGREYRRKLRRDIERLECELDAEDGYELRDPKCGAHVGVLADVADGRADA
jgi:hypothetical protein